MVVRASSAWRKEIMLKNWFTGTGVRESSGPPPHRCPPLMNGPCGAAGEAAAAPHTVSLFDTSSYFVKIDK
jgi:hypothetical protein